MAPPDDSSPHIDTGSENPAFLTEQHQSEPIAVSPRSHSPERQPEIFQPPVEFRTYKRRWFVLLVVCLLNMSNSMLWISYAPVANYTDEFYCTHKNCGAADWLSLVFMIASIPMGFVAMWSVDKYGLRPGILLGSWATFIGAIIRIISSIGPISTEAKFGVVLLGQIIAACAQPFIMYLPTKLAALWFPENQRATANTFGSMSNPLGILLAMVISPQIVNSKSRILLLNGVMTAPAATVTLLANFGICHSLPPTPPTSSAAEISLPFWPGFKSAFRVKAFLVLVFCLGGGMGLFNAIYTLIQQILCPKGYNNDFAGLCGALLIVGGLIGSGISGVIVDKTKKFQLVAKLSYALAAVSACAFAIVSLRAGLAPSIAVLSGLFGAFGFAIYPIGLELGVECTYPVAEATSAGLIIISGQIQGIIYVILMQVLIRKPSELDKAREQCTAGKLTNVAVHDWMIPNLLWCALACLMAAVFAAFFWPKLKRREAEAANLKRAVTQVSS